VLGFVVPLWLGARVADCWLHRRSRIEATSGARESEIHAPMLAEDGLPMMVGLFRTVNAGVLGPTAGLLGPTAGALGVPSLTAALDVAYTEQKRAVSTTEQQVHSLLEVVPLLATVVLFGLHPGQGLALVGRGKERARFGREPKPRPISLRTRRSLLGAVVVFGTLPYAEEFWRCWNQRQSLASTPPRTRHPGAGSGR
jgi:hypothetical protein